MKHTKFFIFALVAAMTFSACGTDDTCSSIFLKTVVIPVAVIQVAVIPEVEAQVMAVWEIILQEYLPTRLTKI